MEEDCMVVFFEGGGEGGKVGEGGFVEVLDEEGPDCWVVGGIF